MTDQHDDYEDDFKSKSQLKREMTALQKLGEALLELPEKALKTIPIPDELQEQLDLARRITHHTGRKRQMQYIGKIMRQIDTAPIQAAMDEIANGRKQLNRQLHDLEALRDRVLTGGDPAIDEVVARYSDTDRQQLRQLQRQARKELEENKPPAAARKIFKYLRELAEL